MCAVRWAVVSTAASGAGCGLLALLGVFASGEAIPSDRWFGLAALGAALGALGLGIVSSAFHPDSPRGVLRAVSRWRSDRRSRAAVLAGAACAAAAAFAVGWIGYGEVGGAWRACGLAAALFAGLAVHATAMIYAARETVHEWSNRWVAPLFLALALHTGALWLNALLTLFDRANPDGAMIVVAALFLSFYLKRRHWRFVDAVRALAPPEPAAAPTAEAGEPIARRRAVELRRYAFVLLFALPLALTLAAIEAAQPAAALAAAAAALAGSAGAVVERRLFFAEAVSPDAG